MSAFASGFSGLCNQRNIRQIDISPLPFKKTNSLIALIVCCHGIIPTLLPLQYRKLVHTKFILINAICIFLLQCFSSLAWYSWLRWTTARAQGPDYCIRMFLSEISLSCPSKLLLYVVLYQPPLVFSNKPSAYSIISIALCIITQQLEGWNQLLPSGIAYFPRTHSRRNFPPSNIQKMSFHEHLSLKSS